jgi:DNA-directed RNA polymerase specialized sigma24 family protein
VNDPNRDVGAAIFAASPDPASRDGWLLGRIGQSDDDAMAAFYREHGRVVLAQVLLVTGDRVLADRAGSGPGPEATALDRAELASVRVAIRDLGPAHREVLGLVFGSGLSLPEVAGVLEIPVGTVKSRLTAARAALSRILDEKGQNR